MTTQETILTRRSVRAYTAEQITGEQLRTILDAAYAAPVAGALYKTMRLTVIQNSDVLEKIKAAYREGGIKPDMLFGAPTLILVSGEKTFDATALFANTGCIVENIQLSAWAMGLGAVFNWAAGTILPEKKELLTELGIPEDFKPLAGVVIGHPAKEVSERKRKEVFVTNYIQ